MRIRFTHPLTTHPVTSLTARFLPSSLLATAVLLLAGCGSGTGNPSNLSSTFHEWVVPVASNEPSNPPAGCWPDDLTMDSHGNIWFAEHHSDQIGRFSPSGADFVYTGYPVPSPTSEMDSIAIDETRNLVWVSENATRNVVKLDLNAAVPLATEVSVSTPDDLDPIPGDITLDKNGIPWITEGYEGGPVIGQVAEINPVTSELAVFKVPTQPGGLDGLHFDAAGDLWVVELTANKIARLQNGLFTEFTLPRPDTLPTNLGIDSHGFIWVTEQTGNAIARFNPNDTTGHPWIEIPVNTPSSLPSGITVDRNDNVWFTEFGSSKIGVIPNGASIVSDFSIPTTNSGPEDILAAPDGRIFFTEQYGNRVGQISVAGLTP